MSDINERGIVNVYWSAFEQSGNPRDFLTYKSLQNKTSQSSEAPTISAEAPNPGITTFQ